MTDDTQPEFPEPSFTETPEFQDAVAKAAAKAVADAMEQISQHGAPAGTGTDQQATGLFRQLALAIAEVGDQGTNRKRVAPEILAARDEAGKRAQSLIDLARKRNLRPEYRVVGKLFFNDRFIEPFRRLNDKSIVANEITWTGMPNEALQPLNDTAREIFTAYRASIGQTEKTPNADGSAVWVTAGGLVVKGDPPKRSTVGNELPTFRDDVVLAGEERPETGSPNDPTARFVNVLGTVAHPAQQNPAGHEHRGAA